MVRTQIQLTTDQHKRLKSWAQRLGISLSEAVRRCVNERLNAEKADSDKDELLRQALSVIGKYSDRESPSTVGRDHDEHLDRALRR